MQKIVTIDCQYVRPRFAAAFLMIENDRALFIENNTAHSVPLLLDALKAEGLSPKQIEYLIITHVHLDHAGGTSKLLQACPNARVLAHPKAARHVIDPSKLIRSARKVYGDENYEKLYGQIESVAAERVLSMQDGETLQFGDRTLRFIHTRGHANHHFCIYDSGSNGVFTGDSFGLAYPLLQENGLFIFPSTSPTDYDPSEAKLSIEKIVGTGAERVFLTHYGEFSGRETLQTAARQLATHLDFSEDLLDRAVKSPLPDSELRAFCRSELYRYYGNHLSKTGAVPTTWELISLDLDLNADGIAYVAQNRRHPAR